MTHAYRHPIAVTPDADGRPAALDWRGVAYRVLDIFSTWHLRDRWWEGRGEETGGADGAGGAEGGAGEGASDRTYYRLRCVSASGQSDLLCEVYRDAARAAWVLERVYD